MTVFKALTGIVLGAAALSIIVADTTPAFAENWTIPVVIRTPPLDMTGRTSKIPTTSP
jgi:hypothetical protein